MDDEPQGQLDGAGASAEASVETPEHAHEADVEAPEVAEARDEVGEGAMDVVDAAHEEEQTALVTWVNLRADISRKWLTIGGKVRERTKRNERPLEADPHAEWSFRGLNSRLNAQNGNKQEASFGIALSLRKGVMVPVAIVTPQGQFPIHDTLSLKQASDDFLRSEDRLIGAMENSYAFLGELRQNDGNGHKLLMFGPHEQPEPALSGTDSQPITETESVTVEEASSGTIPSNPPAPSSSVPVEGTESELAA